MRLALRVFAVTLIGSLAVVASSGAAYALDGPFTWEEVLCRSDAAAEIEMIMATTTSPDRMVVRRVMWNRTKHRIRPVSGYPDIPSVTKTRFKLLAAMSRYRHDKHPGPLPEFFLRDRRAIQRGSYRTIVFLDWVPQDNNWSGGGVAYSGVEWLDHPQHAEWWAKIQPYLRQIIEASKRNEKPAFCADVSPAASQLSPESRHGIPAEVLRKM